MAWQDTLIDIPGTGLKAVNLNALPPEAWSILSSDGSAKYQDVRNVYDAVATVNRGVDIRANALNKMPWQIRRINGEDAIWEAGQPAPPELMWCKNLPQLLKLTGAAKTLVSESFWFIERNRARPLSLRWWSPLATRPHWDDAAGLDYFERSIGKGITRYELEDVCYIWEVHPLHETQPKPSPAQAALAAANVLYSVDRLAADYFERGAIKATLLAVSGATTREEKERIQSWWQRVTSGIKNAFTAHVINADAVTPIVIGEGLSELNNAELSADKRYDVAIALGIPHSMLFADAANYATAQQDELNFYNSTVIPDAESIAGQVNEQLFNRYGYHFEWLPETMDVFQQDENTRAQAFAQYASAGVPLSLIAEMLGLELPQGWEYADLDATPEPQPITIIDAQATQGQGQPGQAQPRQLAMADAAQDATQPDNRKAAEADTFRRWLRKNPNRLARPGDFNAHVLTDADKAAIVAEFQAEDGAAEDSPFFVTLPTDGNITPEWWRATKATLQLSADDPEAEQAARMAIERRAAREMSRGLEEWLTEALDGLTEAEVRSLAYRLRNNQTTFRDILQRALVQSSDLGVSVAFDQFDNIGYGFDYTLVNAGARDWARQYTDDILGQLNTTNDRIVGEAVARWVENGEPLSALELDLRPHFGPVRARRIATTEVTRAYAEANRIAYEESGVVSEIQWKTAADELVCPICGGLSNKRTSVKNPDFGGVSLPPAHVNCRCWIVGVVAEPDEATPTVAQVGVTPPPPPATTIPTFATKDEAVQWMRTNLASEVQLSQGAKLDGLQKIAGAIDNVNSRFDLPKMEYLGDPKKMGIKVKFPPKALAAHFQSTERSGVLFSNKLTDVSRIDAAVGDWTAAVSKRSPMGGLRKALENGIKQGVYDSELMDVFETLTERRWMVSESIEDVINHEMGHRLSYLHQAQNELNRAANGSIKRGWGGILSEYAKTNQQEFIAESFCAYMKGEFNRVSPEMLEWFRTYDKAIP